jgi:riboflavin biosynthesis pyrimidine reductase
MLSPHDLPPDRTSGAERCVAGSLHDWLAAASSFDRVLLFGGGAINRMCYAAGVVDSLVLTVCPVLLGSAEAVPLVAPALPHPVQLTLDHVRSEGNFVFLHYRVHRP